MFYFVVDGSWEEWTKWTSCSKSCEGGETVRTRQCNNPVPQCGGSMCPGNNTEVDSCNVDVSCMY